MFENMDSDTEIVAEFITESMENLDDLDTQILSLEQDPGNKEVLNHVFRAVHTVKGGSGFLNIDEITTVSHKLESVLDDLRNDVLHVTPEILDVVLEGVDTLKKLLDKLIEECEEPGSTKDTVFDMQPVLNKIEGVLNAKVEKSSSETVESTETEQQEVITTESEEDIMFQNLIEENKKTFIEETNEYIETVDNELIKLEKGEEPSSITEVVFRIVHNIKGNSAYLGFAKIEKLTHNFENILDELRKGKLNISPDICKILFKAFDKFKALFDVVVNSGNDTDGNEDIEQIVSEINGLISSTQSVQVADSDANEPPPDTGNQTNDSTDNETIEIFIKNAEIYIKSISENAIVLMNKGDDRAAIDSMLRAMQSLKNASNFTNFHYLENLMTANIALVNSLTENKIVFTGDIVELIFKSVDDSTRFVNSINRNCEEYIDTTLISALNEKCEEIKSKPENTETPKPVQLEPVQPKLVQPKPVQPKPIAPEVKERVPAASASEKPGAPKNDVDDKKKAKSGKVEQTIRVEHSKLDILMNLIGELIINRNHLEMLSEKIGAEYNLPEISKELNKASVSLGKISDDLQTSIMSVRMIPVGTVFNKFPRVVRELAKTKEKEIELVISGEETNLDKTIIEQIGDPLVHLIRNGVDHGIEMPEDRKKANKPPKGTIHLKAFQKADNVIVEIEDDGKGMNPANLRNKAVEKGIISQDEADKLNDDESFNLIFEAGFSTAEKITDISGRGVGMDVVRNNIKKLGGQVYISSKEGKGSKFTLTLPLTLAIIRAIMVKLNNSTYAIPLNTIVETIKIPKKEIQSLKNRKVINLRGEVIGIVDLISLLEISVNGREDNREIIPIVIMADESRKIGFIVEELLKQQEIVIKPLVDFLAKIKGLSGATMLGDGKIVLIIDPADIIALATGVTSEPVLIE